MATKVPSKLLFHKDEYTFQESKNWAKNHGFRYDECKIEGNWITINQTSEKFQETTSEIKRNGLRVVYGIIEGVQEKKKLKESIYNEDEDVNIKTQPEDKDEDKDKDEDEEKKESIYNEDVNIKTQPEDEDEDEEKKDYNLKPFVKMDYKKKPQMEVVQDKDAKRNLTRYFAMIKSNPNKFKFNKPQDIESRFKKDYTADYEALLDLYGANDDENKAKRSVENLFRQFWDKDLKKVGVAQAMGENRKLKEGFAHIQVSSANLDKVSDILDNSEFDEEFNFDSLDYRKNGTTFIIPVKDKKQADDIKDFIIMKNDIPIKRFYFEESVGIDAISKAKANAFMKELMSDKNSTKEAYFKILEKLFGRYFSSAKAGDEQRTYDVNKTVNYATPEEAFRKWQGANEQLWESLVAEYDDESKVKNAILNRLKMYYSDYLGRKAGAKSENFNMATSISQLKVGSIISDGFGDAYRIKEIADEKYKLSAINSYKEYTLKKMEMEAILMHEEKGIRINAFYEERPYEIADRHKDISEEPREEKMVHNDADYQVGDVVHIEGQQGVIENIDGDIISVKFDDGITMLGSMTDIEA